MRFLDRLIRYLSFPYPNSEFRVVKTTRDQPAIETFNVAHDVDWIRLHSLCWIAERVKNQKLDGSVAELGVYKGEFSQYINSLFPSKRLLLFDTFEGFPEINLNLDFDRGYTTREIDIDRIRFSDTHIEIVINKMPHPEHVVFKKGFFPETTIGLEEEIYCFVSIDCDLYEPTLNGLKYFYPRLVKGGYIFLHDYANFSYKGIIAAFDEFEKDNGGISVFPCFDEHGTLIITKN